MNEASSGQVILRSIGVGFVVCLCLATWFRERSLGATLLKMPSRYRWQAWILVVLALLSATYALRGDALGDVALEVCFFLSIASALFLAGRFSVHSNGIVSGSAIIPWSKLEGWEWASPSQQLLLWAPWSAVHLLPFRSIARCKTGQVKSIELEALLQRFARESFRPSPTRLSSASNG